MNIKIEEFNLTIDRGEDEYYIEVYKNDGIEDLLVASFCIEAPLEGLDLLLAIQEALEQLDI